MKTHLKPTKLVATLQLLTPTEFKSFHKWLQSPWANSNKKLVELYRILQKHYPEFTARTLTKEKLFIQLYPEKEYDDKWMRNIMAAMSKQVEKFLVHQRLEKEEVLKKKYLAEEFLERHKNDWYHREINSLIKLLEVKKVKETEDYLMLALIHEDLYHESNAHTLLAQGYSPLQISEVYLDTFYSITKWRHLTELVEQKMIVPINWDLGEKKELLSSLTKQFDIPVIDFYKERLEKVDSIEKEKYFQLKEKYYFVYDRLPLWDRKVIVFYLINMAIRMWIKGDQEIMQELLDLYKFGLENKLLFYYGRLTDATYANVVTVANSLGEFKFCKTIIDDYTQCLADESRRDGKIWATAHWYYKQQLFDKGIELLTLHNFKNDMFVRSSKFLLLQNYFEACLEDDSYYLFFKDFCEAAKKFFKRNKLISKERNMAYVNLIKYAFNFIKINIEKKPAIPIFRKFLVDLNLEKNIQGKKWLLGHVHEKINGLSS